jgi:hypothetical protein
MAGSGALSQLVEITNNFLILAHLYSDMNAGKFLKLFGDKKAFSDSLQSNRRALDNFYLLLLLTA